VVRGTSLSNYPQLVSEPAVTRPNCCACTTPVAAQEEMFEALLSRATHPENEALDATRGRPFGLYLPGNQGTESAERGVEAITAGLGWTKAAATVVVSGKPSKDDLQPCWELGATVAAQLMG
jgi:hypothetical protein